MAGPQGCGRATHGCDALAGHLGGVGLAEHLAADLEHRVASDDEDGLATRRAYTRLTWLWAGVFALRLLVQTPLYLTDATTALAVSKLVMGLPLFALAAWATWMAVRALPPTDASGAIREEAKPPSENVTQARLTG